MILEICAINLESAIAAEKGGASRIELCDNIIEGGTTPSAATIKLAVEYLSIPVNVLIRPRGGDFIYSDLEFENIIEDIKYCKSIGVSGIVIGVLNSDSSIDIKRTKQLVELANPMKVTFHRAFDLCKDVFQSMEDIISTGAIRILTSGQQQSAEKGISLLKKLQSKSNNRIIIMPGGGVSIKNVEHIIAATSVSEIHMSAKTKVPTKMDLHQYNITLSGGDFANEKHHYSSDYNLVRAIAKTIFDD